MTGTHEKTLRVYPPNTPALFHALKQQTFIRCLVQHPHIVADMHGSVFPKFHNSSVIFELSGTTTSQNMPKWKVTLRYSLAGTGMN